MIEFKQDGTFFAPDAGEQNGHWIIGVGSTGVNILDQLVLENKGAKDLMVLDTDEGCIRGSVVAEKYLLGRKTIHGLGTGGDPELARQLFQEELPEIKEMLKGTRLAVIVAGLGGGTASGVLPELIEALKQLGAATLILTTSPFAFEGARRRKQANQTLEIIRKSADAVLNFSNANMIQLTEGCLDLRSRFAGTDSQLARVAVCLRRAMTQRGLMHFNLADIRQLAHDQSVDGLNQLGCLVGSAQAQGEHRIEEVVEQILNNPLFQDERTWVRSHALMVSLTGGADMCMSEFESVIEHLKRQLPVAVPIISAAHVNKAKSEFLELTILMTGDLEDGPVSGLLPVNSKVQSSFELDRPESQIEVEHQKLAAEETREDQAEDFDEEPQFAGFAELRQTSKTFTTEKYFKRQEELPLDKKIPRGRFEKSAPTMWNGQDLDQPTFMRLGIKVKL